MQITIRHGLSSGMSIRGHYTRTCMTFRRFLMNIHSYESLVEIIVSDVKIEDSLCITYKYIHNPWRITTDKAVCYTYNNRDINICIEKLEEVFGKIPTKLYFKKL